MDCRLVPLPTIERVQGYFLWRLEDAHRNSLNAYCYWLLRKEGMDAQNATKQLSGQSTAYKNELLFSRGINYDKLPSWQKRGIGIYWADIKKVGYNPIANQEVMTSRRGLKVDYDLPIGKEYANMVAAFLTSA